MVKRIDIAVPKHWNRCTTDQLELLADVIREQIERQNRYNSFSMKTVKIAMFFALSGIEIVAGPNPRVPVEEQYYICRLKPHRKWLRRKAGKKETFSLYLWQLDYWLSSKAKTNDRNSAEYLSAGAGLMDWLDNKNEMYLTRFPYPVMKRRRSRFRARKVFSGPNNDLDGFSWAQYRFASDTMASYMQISNNLIKMRQMGKFSEQQVWQQVRNVDLAKAMFLATIFNARTKYIDTNTGILKYGFRYESNQCSDNACYFRNFPETKWQVILFWWTGMTHVLSKRYPHVFKVQNIKKQKPSTPLEVYTATTATIQKYAGLTEDQVNHQSYSLVLEHLERLSKENEEMEKLRRKH